MNSQISSSMFSSPSDNIKHIPIIKHEDIVFDKVIGQGGFGEVWLGTYTPTKQKVAIKKLFASELDKEIVHEITIHCSLSQKFLIAFIGCTNTPPYLIVTEYASNGSLFNALHEDTCNLKLSSTDLTIFAFGIASGMQYLHENNVIHRDLKTLNILIDSKRQPRICDFGISSLGNTSDNSISNDFGTAAFMAPELLYQRPYDKSVDVYAFGMVLWEMQTREIPFCDLQPMQIFYEVGKMNRRPTIPDDTPQPLADLITKCWSADPSERPTFAQIVTKFSNGEISFKGTADIALSNFLSSFGSPRSASAFNCSEILLLKAPSAISLGKPHSFSKTTRPTRINRKSTIIYSIDNVTAVLSSNNHPDYQDVLAFLCNTPTVIQSLGIKFWTLLLQQVHNLSVDEYQHRFNLNSITPPKESEKIQFQITDGKPPQIPKKTDFDATIEALLIAAKNPIMLHSLSAVPNLNVYIIPDTLELFLYLVTFEPNSITTLCIMQFQVLILRGSPETKEMATILLLKLLQNIGKANSEISSSIVDFLALNIDKFVNHEIGATIARAISIYRSNDLSMPAFYNMVKKFLRSTVSGNLAVSFEIASYLKIPIPFDTCIASITSESSLVREAATQYTFKEFLKMRFDNSQYDPGEISNETYQYAKKVILALFSASEVCHSMNQTYLLCSLFDNKAFKPIFDEPEILEKLFNISDDVAPNLLSLFVLMAKNNPELLAKEKAALHYLSVVILFGDEETFAVACQMMTGVLTIGDKAKEELFMKNAEDIEIISMVTEKVGSVESPKAFSYGALLLAKFAQKTYNIGYANAVDSLVNMIKKGGLTASSSIEALVEFSKYPELMKRIRISGVGSYLPPYMNVPNVAEFTRVLMDKIGPISNGEPNIPIVHHSRHNTEV